MADQLLKLIIPVALWCPYCGARHVDETRKGERWDRARDAVINAAAESGMVLCGWGNHGLYKQRGLFIREMLHAHGIEPHILRLTGQDQPEHPLYIPYTVEPVPWPYEPPKAAVDEREAARG